MDLWHARHQSQIWLETVLISESQHLVKGYTLVDETITRFNQISQHDKSNFTGRFARVCALTTAKGRNLLLGCHSLALDGLAQESGALLRPLLESVELLPISDSTIREQMRRLMADCQVRATLPKPSRGNFNSCATI